MPQTLSPVLRTSTGVLFGLVGTIAAASAADSSAIPIASMGDGKAISAETEHVHSWELPPLTVEGVPASPVRDDDRVGTYAQPRWSTTRRFTEVRTYVIPEGQFDFEYWLFVSTPTKHEIDAAKAAGEEKPKPSIKQQYEAELGIGYRMQVDIYQVYEKEGAHGDGGLEETKFELRYALADWDKIWANPTLYAEWIQEQHGSDQAEFKLLLCDDFNPRWMWATNFVFQESTGETRARSHEWNSAIAYNAIDTKLSVGVETNFAYVSAREVPSESARDHHYELAAGPSIRWYPTPHAHIILAEFIGMTHDTSQSKTVGIVGWEF